MSAIGEGQQLTTGANKAPPDTNRAPSADGVQYDELVVSTPQDTEFSFEADPGRTAYFDAAAKSSFSLPETYCIATVKWSEPHSRAKAEHQLRGDHQRLTLHIPWETTLGDLSLSSPGKIRLQSWAFPVPCFRHLFIKADKTEDKDTQTPAQARIKRANEGSRLEQASIQAISLMCFGVNADRVELETSGRLLSIMRFPGQGGTVFGQWGAIALLLGGRPKNPSEASRLNIRTSSGPVALETVLVDGDCFSGPYIATSQGVKVVSTPGMMPNGQLSPDPQRAQFAEGSVTGTAVESILLTSGWNQSR